MSEMSRSLLRLSARASSNRRCRPFFTGQLPRRCVRPGSVSPPGPADVPVGVSAAARGVPIAFLARPPPGTNVVDRFRRSPDHGRGDVRPRRAATRRIAAVTAPWWRSAVFYQIYPRSFATERRATDRRPRRHRAAPRPPRRGSASTPCGSRRSIRRRRPTSATTSPTSATSTRSSATSTPSTTCWRRATSAGCGCSSTSCPTTRPTSTRGSRRPGRAATIPKRDWYVWRDGDPDTPPNNWRGGVHRRAGLDVGRDHGQWYLHQFLPAQPDLELGQPRGRRGHARRHAVLARPRRRRLPHRRRPRHRQGPGAARRPARGRRASPTAASTTAPETHELIRGMRKLVDSYPGDRLILGEVYLLSTEQVAEYYGDGDELHLSFNFPPLLTPWDAGRWRAQIADTHRLDRRPRRLGRRGCCRTTTTPATARATAARTAPAPRRSCCSGCGARRCSTRARSWGSRTPSSRPSGSSTPADATGAGRRSRGPAPPTTAGASPTPGCRGRPTPATRNVEAQLADRGAIVHLYRRLLVARRASPALRLGAYEPVDAPGDVIAWRRTADPGGAPTGPATAWSSVNMGPEPADGRRWPAPCWWRATAPARASRSPAPWAPTSAVLLAPRRADRRPVAPEATHAPRQRVDGAGSWERASSTSWPSPSNARAASPLSRSQDRTAGDVGPPPGEQPRRPVAAHEGLDVGPGGDQRGVEIGVPRQLADPGRGQGHRRAVGRVDPVAGRQAAARRRPAPGRRRPRPAGRRPPTALTCRPSRPRTRPRSPRRPGRTLGDGDDRQVGQHVADRPVDGAGPLLAPRRHRLGHAAGPALQAAGLLDAPPRHVGVGRLAVPVAGLVALVERPCQPPALDELVALGRPQGVQVSDVGGRVGQRILAERASQPVGRGGRPSAGSRRAAAAGAPRGRESRGPRTRRRSACRPGGGARRRRPARGSRGPGWRRA